MNSQVNWLEKLVPQSEGTMSAHPVNCRNWIIAFHTALALRVRNGKQAGHRLAESTMISA